MNPIKKLLHYFENPRAGKLVMLSIWGRYIKDDAKFIQLKYKYRLGCQMDFSNPKTFNEKLNWLKIYDRKPIYTTMVDKCDAKIYVANIIGEEHIIPTLAVYDRPEEIDFDSLPEQFVLKCTHDSGGLVICRDKKKLDKNKALEKLKKSLKKNYYWENREWPYKNVRPRIIVEQYMSMGGAEIPLQITNSIVLTEKQSTFMYQKDLNTMPQQRLVS